MDVVLHQLDEAFADIHRRSREILERLDEADLFRRPDGSKMSMAPFSCGEYILRSAGAVEQTFDGITTRLWDDPFEWTLPEKLSTKNEVIEYLDEVEVTRRRGFSFFASDDDLRRELPAPEKIRSLAWILVDTLSRASHLQGRAFAIYQTLTGDKLPRLN
jgi:hypothetical protein